VPRGPISVLDARGTEADDRTGHSADALLVSRDAGPKAQTTAHTPDMAASRLRSITDVGPDSTE